LKLPVGLEMATLFSVARAAGCCCLILAALQATAADNGSECQATGWNMNRELKAFATAPQSAAAGSAVASEPLLRVDTLYALRLRAQGDVQFVQTSGRAEKVATPMAGMARFTVLTSGSYRVTVDAPLWIDVVGAAGIIAPSDYRGWHECGVFRKSVDYTLEAGQTVTLQFSSAATDLVKVTIEPPTS